MKLEKIIDGRKQMLKAAHQTAIFRLSLDFWNKHFSQINQYLEENGETPIDWSE